MIQKSKTETKKAKADHSALVSKIRSMLNGKVPLTELHCIEVSNLMESHRESCGAKEKIDGVGCPTVELKWPSRKGLLIGVKEFLEKCIKALEGHA